VGPKIASIFFAADRYDGSFKIKKWLKEGKFVIADRYVSSNAGHQGGKIDNDQERREFINWLYALEYDLFKIPRPDFVIFLKTKPEFSIKSLKEKKNKDIHELDLNHLKGAYKAYQQLLKEENNFKSLEVTKDGEFLPPKEINKKILNLIF
jgi:dTMP kinase